MSGPAGALKYGTSIALEEMLSSKNRGETGHREKISAAPGQASANNVTFVVYYLC